MTHIPAGWKPRLSCPFCGSTCLFTVPDEHGSGGQWVPPIHVGCNGCQAEQVADTEDEAVERWNRRSSPASVAPGDAQDEKPQRNGCGSVSFKLSDGSAVSCDWSTHEWELSIPATRHERDIAFKELLQEIGRLRASVAAPAAGDALALLDHPLLRDVLGYIEDAGPADVWRAAQSWMALRDAALAAQVPQRGEA